MSKNTNLSFLTDYITADITNGRIGINNASPAFAFDVVGVAKFSSSVSASDLIISDTYANDPLIKLATTTSGSVEVQMRTASTTYNAGIGVVTSGYDFNFFTANSTRMTITSAGNVGIGTSSPAAKLDVVSSGRVFNFGTSATTTGNFYGALVYNGSDIALLGNGPSIVSGAAAIDFAISTGNASANMIFAMNNTERMRITSGGLVCIGTTTTGYKLHVEGTSANYTMLIKQAGGDASYQPLTVWHAAESGNRRYLDFAMNVAGNNVGSIVYNSGTGNIQYNTTSDYRIKSELENFDALNIVSKLNPVKGRIGESELKSLFFLAHELQEHLPQAVIGIKDDIDKNGKPILQSVDYSQLTALLTKAIQELSAEITIISNKIK
jgi:hypothetical protein